MSVSQRIAELVKKEGSQSKFAEKVGISQSALSYLIKKDTGARADTLIQIAKAYPRLRTEWLLLGEGAMWHDEDYVAPVDPQKETEDELVERMNKLLEQRVAELEREIKRNNPDLAEELGIE